MSVSSSRSFELSTLLLCAGAVLAMRPLAWLVPEWSAGAAHSRALLAATLLLGLLVWWLDAEQQPGSSANCRYVCLLLLAGAALRALGHPRYSRKPRRAGAALELYALGALAGVPRERRGLPSPAITALTLVSAPLDCVLPGALNQSMQRVAAIQ